MSVKAVAAAIRAVGETAWLLGKEEKKPFVASIQPHFRDTGKRSSPLGPGEKIRYHLYTDCDETALSLRRGDRILWNGAHYAVDRIDTIWVADQAVCRKGELSLAVGEEE